MCTVYLGLRYVLVRLHGSAIRHQPLSQHDLDSDGNGWAAPPRATDDTLKLNGDIQARRWTFGSRAVQLTSMS